jgi:hypothetical protein
MDLGTKLYNNRRKKIYEVFGRVSPCEVDTWETLYRSDDMPLGDFRQRPYAEFFKLNRDKLPRFVQLSDRLSESGVDEWIDGYQSGLRFPPVPLDDAQRRKCDRDGFSAWKDGYDLAKQHLQDKLSLSTTQEIHVLEGGSIDG